jgi:hypothetical protein
MSVPTSEVGYTSATTGRGDHEVHMGHVVALGGNYYNIFSFVSSSYLLFLNYSSIPSISNLFLSNTLNDVTYSPNCIVSVAKLPSD